MTIALIDDHSYGLDQIRALHTGEEYRLSYFETFREFASSGEHFDVVYLDYYLEKDGLTGADVIEEVQRQSKKIIGFSSVWRKSQELKRLGADEAMVKE